MKKLFTTLLSLFVIIMISVIIAGVYKFNFTNDVVVLPEEKITNKIQDVKNIDYTINGEVFTLIHGTASKEIAPGSATKNTLTMFGEPVYGDLNGDGLKDAAILLANNTGGSGTFYYAVLAIATGTTTYKATNALILGDRIAPQTVEIQNGRAVYNYAERKATEPMTTPPSLGKSLWINYDVKTGQIGELVQNFEGEADPSMMSLGMKKWTWIKTQMSDGKITTPKKSNAFTLTFNKDGRVVITTDCNSMNGVYIVKNKTLVFNQMISTMMYCDGSQEQEFANTLNNVGSYLFTSKGELILEIKMDSGTMILR